MRQIPGALGNEQSSEFESFSNGLLDYVHYTRPQTVRDVSVPSVLVSGDHEAIGYWRLKQSLGRTWLRRPELLESVELNEQQRQALIDFQNEYKQQRKT